MMEIYVILTIGKT
ncbi:Protein of unknown function [Bacillus cytotoxicus]|uniref:Uncharacterized protein n=1 Tax=Bacillus cytotoxicus TaxID=580165 RepID=A0AAX2CH88_9BACI|nr:Protein of unknown function [Bacillus cytotoxicus]SCN37292.1 Protein of unknown function [Bacillus cytotoxicus]